MTRLQFKEDPTKHIAVTEVTILSAELFTSELSDQLVQGDTGEVVIFVPGFNVSFAESLKIVAQVAYDVNFAGVPILYSWPSVGSLTGYAADEERSRWASNDLVSSLRQIQGVPGVTNVHVLSHGMGSRTVADALVSLAPAWSSGDLPILDQVIFAAPDIDAEEFRIKVQTVANVSDRVTVYVSANDQTLAVAEQLHGSARAGQAVGDFALVPGVDTIDVSSTTGALLGHAYYRNTMPVLADLHYVFSGVSADERLALTRVTIDGGEYWKLRP